MDNDDVFEDNGVVTVLILSHSLYIFIYMYNKPLSTILSALMLRNVRLWQQRPEMKLYVALTAQ